MGRSQAGCDSYIVMVTNSGSLPADVGGSSPITITDTLPGGFTVDDVQAEEQRYGQTMRCSTAPAVECTDSSASSIGDGQGVVGELGVGDVIVFRVYVAVPPSAAGPVTNAVTVSGGGASAPAVESFQNTVGSVPAAPGLDFFGLTATGPDGNLDTQAGDHPFGVTSTFNFGTRLPSDVGLVEGHGGEELDATYGPPAQEVKDVIVDLPLGFVGDVQAAAQCAEVELEKSTGKTGCPPSSQVGMVDLDLGGDMQGSYRPGDEISGVYNMVPERGAPAEFGFNFLGKAVMLYGAAVPTPAGYVLQVSSPGVPKLEFGNLSLTFWGVPAEASHTPYRFAPLSENPVESGVAPVGFVTNPVDCSTGPLKATAMADTWEDPGSYLPDGSPNLSDPAWQVLSTTVYPSMTGCELLTFAPGIAVTPTTTQADEPTGLTVDLQVPQAPQLPPNLTTPELKNVTVTFPAGMSLSPSAADGLQACTPEEIGLESRLPGSCPDASVLGSVKVTTPLLPMPLEGQLFLGAPGCDPCSNADAADGNMFRLFIEVAGAGVVIKLPGTAYVNTATGQVTSTFLNNPQLPFSDFQLQLKGGLRAPLATPQSCGTFTTTTDFTPWSTPITPDATPSSSFEVNWDGNGGACPASLPLNPGFSAGTSNPNAGQFSPLTLTFNREDREQDLAGIQVKTPPGLLGVLTGVPLCGEPQADLGTCPESSRIGTMTVAAGPGAHPFYENGSLYLTGPYRGAPFGLSIVVPTVAGPFNLGNVVVRAKIEVDPTTAALTVTSDPLPQILDGIPLRLRTANVTVDRPGFIFNPTDCGQLHIEGTLTGAQGAVAHVSAPFAVSGCKGLGFAPKFSVYTSGHTSRMNGASLYVKLDYPRGASSNISHVKVELPKQLPARLTTLQKACPAATFEANPAACPTQSLVGMARATTPVLPVPLTGPAYFVSHGGEAFPNLIVVLQGYGVRIDLVGDTFISKQGITSSTFTNVPDVQVSSFELYLPEGPYSALAANGNLCKQKLALPADFTAQDGAQLKEDTPVQVTGCAKARVKGSRKARRARKASGAKEAAGVRAAGTRRGALMAVVLWGTSERGSR